MRDGSSPPTKASPTTTGLTRPATNYHPKPSETQDTGVSSSIPLGT